MKTSIDVPDYSPETGLKFIWEEGFSLQAKAQGESVAIRGNAAGLISLARHLLVLAQSGVPSGSHFHLDDLNALEDGSCELVFEKF